MQLPTTTQPVIKRIEPSADGADNMIVDLVELLQKIDTDSPLAKLNETSMPDSNGGRIKF